MQLHFLVYILIFCYVDINYIFCKDAVLYIDLEKSVKYYTGNKFFSVALDTALVAEHFKHFDMTNERLIKLVKHLSPGYLRIGGNMADRLIFSESDENFNSDHLHINYECIYDEVNDCHMDFPNFTMTGNDWVKLNEFSKNVGTKILFDLNVLLRNDDGSWNSENAKELMSFSCNRGFINIDWQLGNEPNAFKHVFNSPLNASQLAKDFSELRKILNEFSCYKNSLLIGPDTTRPTSKHSSSVKYLKEFLQNVNNSHTLNAIAFHQYYLNGRTATAEDFLNSSTFSLLNNQLKVVKRIARVTGFNLTSLWLSETSSAYGGGAPGLSNSFVGSFLWLDKLGLAAKFGVQVVVRQSLFRDYYALIDNDYNPTPDWWLSVIYKKLVSSEVLSCNLTALKSLRLYCQCSAMAVNGIPAITVFGVNIANKSASIEVKGLEPGLKSLVYILTSSESSLESKNVLVNGNILELSQQGDLPVFPEKIVDTTKPLIIPPYSLIFWAIPSRKAKMCQQASVILY